MTALFFRVSVSRFVNVRQMDTGRTYIGGILGAANPGNVVLPLRLQREQPNSKTGPLIFNEDLGQLLLGLQGLIRSLNLGSNVCNIPQSGKHIAKNLVFGLDLQAITTE